MANNDMLGQVLPYAAIGVVAWLLLKDKLGGVKEAVDGTGGAISEIAQGVSSPFNLFDTIFDELSNRIKNANKDTILPPPNYSNAGTVTAANPINKVSSTGSAYNLRVDTITTSKGSSNIIAAPNTYYKNLGVGFDAKGNGYSSMFNGNKNTAATSIFTPIKF